MAKRSQAPAPLSPEASRDQLLRAVLPGAAAHSPTPRAGPEALTSLAAGGYSEAEIFELVVPKRTLARRQARKESLTVEETDRALRLARIGDLARRVFGDDEKAHRWLRKSKRELNGQAPIAFLASESGARTVEQMLNRIDRGMFA